MASAWWQRIGALLGSFAFSLLGVEAGTRVLTSDGSWYDLEMWRWREELRVPDATRGWAHRPQTACRLAGVEVQTDARGLRLAAEAPPGGRRILLLGDSISFGWGVPAPETFAGRLPALLAAQGPIEVLNTGVPGYGTLQEVATAEAIGWALDPSVVVLAWFVNDAEPLAPPVPDPAWTRSRAALLVHTRLHRLRRAGDPSAGFADSYRALHQEGAPGWVAAREALQHLGDRCAREGVPCLVALLPELHVLGPEAPLAGLYAQVTPLVRAAGLEVVDLGAAFPPGEGRPYWVSDEDAHPNAEGHRLLAQGLAQALEPLLAREAR